ncbi:MAG: ubiquinol-cytochrome C reductase, partial [Nocardioides sp.]
MNDNLPAGRSTTEVEADPIANPGLPAHVWRPTDVDPRAEKRAERQVALLFGLSALCTIAFLVSYFALSIGEGGDTFLGLGASTVALGLFMGGAFLLIGIGVIQWARKLMSDHEIIEERYTAASPPEDRQETLK